MSFYAMFSPTCVPFQHADLLVRLSGSRAGLGILLHSLQLSLYSRVHAETAGLAPVRLDCVAGILRFWIWLHPLAGIIRRSNPQGRHYRAISHYRSTRYSARQTPFPFKTGAAFQMRLKALSLSWRDDRGQDIAEYAVMLGVILTIVVGTIRLIGSHADNVFSSVGSAIQ
jgi:Flp pilus assembly pilin Flp